jgi:hypothetical protein
MSARHIPLVSAMLAGLSLSAASGAAAQGIQLFAVLNGGNEVTNTGQAAVGDPDGSGAASVIFVGSTRICFSLLVDDIDAPVAAHIHENVAGKNGPIVVNFFVPPAGNPGTASRCLSDLDPAVLRRIGATPSHFYVNVHTAAFPSGAVRGQLF